MKDNLWKDLVVMKEKKIFPTHCEEMGPIPIETYALLKSMEGISEEELLKLIERGFVVCAGKEKR